MEQQQKWRRLNGTRIKQPIEDEVRQMLMKEKENGYALKVCIGTDSQRKGKEIEFATVIVFIRKGKGGFMYIHNEMVKRKMAIKERIRLLVASYISLASFIDDDLVDFLESNEVQKRKGKVIRIYNRVFKDYEKLRKEIMAFDPFSTSDT